MADTHTLKFSGDEIEIIVDALTADMESYLEAAKEARMQNNRDDIVMFSDAAQRIGAVLERLQPLIDD